MVVSVNSVSSFKLNIPKTFMEFLIEISKVALRPPDTGGKVTDVLLTSSIYRIQGKAHGNNRWREKEGIRQCSEEGRSRQVNLTVRTDTEAIGADRLQASGRLMLFVLCHISQDWSLQVCGKL